VRFRRFHAALELGFCKATANVGALLQAASATGAAILCKCRTLTVFQNKSPIK
jgi:hypothetical protein